MRARAARSGGEVLQSLRQRPAGLTGNLARRRVAARSGTLGLVEPLVSILVVEDDREINHVIRELLADEKISTLGATSLREAWNHIRTRNVIGVILDYSLPDGVADQLLAELEKATHPPGVVLASAHPNAAEVAKRYGITCLRKPLDLDVVLATVRGFIAGEGQPMRPR